ncbi:MAG: hypothetical protein IPN95_18305 [Bacteroidetes bacterium]|nr:hypothetical protein [Bacteroidota bacterium]
MMVFHVNGRDILQQPFVVLPDHFIHGTDSLDEHLTGFCVLLQGMCPQSIQMTQAGDDVLRDVTAVLHSRKPTESSVVQLCILEFLQGPVHLCAHFGEVKQQADVAFALRFILRIDHPGCLFEQQVFELLIFLQVADQGFFVAVFPLIEDGFDPWM